MDHLNFPAIKDPAHPPMEVPYLCNEPYDGLDFESYPARMGYHQLVSVDHSDEFYKQVNSNFLPFLQNWLYFGFLEAVLGTHMRIEDFVYHNGTRCLVTSRALPQYLEACQDRLRRMTVRELESRVQYTE